MYNGIIFRTKEEANMCLLKVKEAIMEKGYIKIGEMYEICDVKMVYNHNFDKFVLTNLDEAEIYQYGPHWYELIFPDAIRIEDIQKEEGVELSLKEFAKQMQQIRDDYSDDPEEQHIRMDALLCAQLRGLGYGEAVDIYIHTKKYYA